MLIYLRQDHKDHLKLLMDQPEEVLTDFCELAANYIQSGPNTELYATAAAKLALTADCVQKTVLGLVNLLLMACEHQLSEADFRDSILMLGFKKEHELILSAFYDSKKAEIQSVYPADLAEPHFHDLQWRFEVQLGSRSLLRQATPLITMDLAVKTKANPTELDIQHCLFQIDPTNLVHLVDELGRALNESQSRHARGVQRTLEKYPD